MCLPASIYDAEQLSEDASLEVIAHARDLGVTMLDTAGAILRHGSAAWQACFIRIARQPIAIAKLSDDISCLRADIYGVGASERLLGESELPLSNILAPILCHTTKEQQALETTMSSKCTLQPRH